MTAILGTETRTSDLKLDYLNLLVAQLQNQNPLEPMDNAEMTSQLAQISQLEQLEYVNQSFGEVLQATQLNQAASLIGKDVSFIDTATGAALSGPVSRVLLEGGTPLLQVGSYVLGLSDLRIIGESPLSEATFADRQAAAGMLGKTVSYKPEGDEAAVIGHVTGATVRNGQAYVTFTNDSGEHTAPLGDVTVVDESDTTVSDADRQYAGSLLGRTIRYHLEDDRRVEQGLVSEVKVQSDGLYLVVGEHDVPLNNVLDTLG